MRMMRVSALIAGSSWMVKIARRSADHELEELPNLRGDLSSKDEEAEVLFAALL